MLLSEDVSNQYDDEQSDYLMKDFLNLTGDASDDSFHGIGRGGDTIALTDQLEFQFLSDQLDIAITDNGENPRLDVSTLYSLFISIFDQIHFLEERIDDSVFHF